MEKVKKILVACGTGIATSTLVVKKLDAIFKERGYTSNIIYSTCSVAELEPKAPNYDLIITTAQCNKILQTKVMLGVVFLTGIGIEPTLLEIIKHLGLEKQSKKNVNI